VTFERAWLLPLLVLPLAWTWWEWSRTPRRAGLVVKALSLAAVLLALAGPVLPVWETKMAVAVLVDTSASVPKADLERASRLAAEIEDKRGRNQVQLMPFAEEIRPPLATERQSELRLSPTPGAAGRHTNLEAAVLDGIAAMPPGLVPAIVLITDGKENHGSILRAAWQARRLGIPVDTYPLPGRPEPSLRLESASFPTLTFAGEKFPIDLSVHSPEPAAGEITITAAGKTLGASPVRLRRGVNRLTVRASLNTGGAFDIAGVLSAGALGEVRFAHAVTVRRPTVLYVSQDPPGTEVHLVRALEAAEFQVTRAPVVPPEELSAFQVIILNNCNLEAIPARQKLRLEEFVRQGGGLLVIGGERNIYSKQDREKTEDPLERALPATVAPPKSPESTCVVLIIDKSSSMEGKKMELARLSAIGVVDNLRAVDRVGVLIFDNSFRWAVPIRRAEDRTLIKRLISGITPDGGTQIAPALVEAYRRVLPVKATFKHIVLLTDGISEEGNSIALAREAASRRITISTVGLGQDVNKAYLEKVAVNAGGKAYFLTDPSGLARILLRDVMEHTGHTAVEKAVVPVVARDSEILDGVNPEEMPPLKGYIRFEAKPTAETILKFQPKDPLLVRWQYGLGRSVVFTSDAKSRWAEAWVGWRGFDTFWTNLMRDLLPHSQAGEARLTYDPANGEIIVDYRLAPERRSAAPPPDIFVIGPEGFRAPVLIHKVAPGAYRGRVPIGERQGLFRVRPLKESRDFPEAGIYIQERELTEFGSDAELLRRVAEFTGGRYRPAAGEVFDTGGRATASTLPLWPGLLGIAILLNLAELIQRKWRGLAGFVRERRS